VKQRSSEQTTDRTPATSLPSDPEGWFEMAAICDYRMRQPRPRRAVWVESGVPTTGPCWEKGPARCGSRYQHPPPPFSAGDGLIFEAVAHVNR